MTLHRRDFLAIGLGAAALAAGGPAHALSEADATALIQTTIDELRGVLETAGGVGARAAKLQAVMERRANMPQIAKFSAGRVWLEMSEAQQSRYQGAFSKYVAIVYAQRFGDVTNQPQITIASVVDAGRKGFLVSTLVDPREGQSIGVDWLVSDRGGQTEIVDMVVEGISMAATQREEIAALFQSKGGDVDALIAALEDPKAG